MNKFGEIYQGFINLATDAEEKTNFPYLKPVEQMALNLLSSYWFKDQKITVVESTKMTPKVSSNSIFRYLKKLRQKGYIELIVDETNNRVKYVTATRITEAYFLP